jgi:hypothetical protein
MKGVVCTVGLSGGGKIISLSLKKLSGGALAPPQLRHYSLVQSVFEYDWVIWCQSLSTRIQNLDNIQFKFF